MRVFGTRAIGRRRFAIASLAMTVLLALAACSGGGASDPYAVAGSSPAPASVIAASEAPSKAASAAPSSGGGRGDYNYDTPAGTSASPPSGPRKVLVGVTKGPLGAWLTGEDGLTLYTFKPDGPDTSTCTGGCAQAWPPFVLTANDILEAGDGVGGTLGTFARPGGVLQVAYNGAPLYSFANDTSPGDTNGQGIGGNWFIATP